MGSTAHPQTTLQGSSTTSKTVLCCSSSAPHSFTLTLQLSPDPCAPATADSRCFGDAPITHWRVCGWELELLILLRPVHAYLCVCPQEFPLLPSLESPEALLPMEFDVAGMVKPITEILTNISRLLLEDLPSSVATKAPDPVVQGNPSDHRATLKGSKSS